MASYFGLGKNKDGRLKRIILKNNFDAIISFLIEDMEIPT